MRLSRADRLAAHHLPLALLLTVPSQLSPTSGTRVEAYLRHAAAACLLMAYRGSRMFHRSIRLPRAQHSCLFKPELRSFFSFPTLVSAPSPSLNDLLMAPQVPTAADHDAVRKEFLACYAQLAAEKDLLLGAEEGRARSIAAADMLATLVSFFLTCLVRFHPC